MTARLSKTRLAVVLGILTSFGPMSIDMYLPALPRIARDFGVATAAVQLTLSVFFIGLAAGQTLYGPLSDRIGRRWPLALGCSVYTLACVGCAIAPSLGALIAARVIQALGACAGMVITRSVVRDLFDARESARMYSFLMLVFGIAPITAPLVGGQLLLAFGWRSIFWLLSGYGVVCLALVLFALPETLPPARRVRAGIGQVLGAYGVVLRDVRFLGYTLTAGFVGGGMFAYIAGSPFVFIELYGVPAERFGWIFGANAAGFIAATQWNRRMLARRGSDEILPVALGALAISGVALIVTAATGAGGLAGLLPWIFIGVAGFGIVSPNSAAAAMAPHGTIAGSASAMIGILHFLVGTAASVIVSALHDGTALPMAGVMGTCGVLAFLSYRSLAQRRPPAARSALAEPAPARSGSGLRRPEAPE